MKTVPFLVVLCLFVFTSRSTHADQQIADNLSVQGLAVGFDATTNENYDFRSLIIKENNTRLFFNDTSNSGSFPTVNWLLEANDSNNGGRNQFSIINDDAQRALLTLEAGAPTNAIYLTDGGNLGLKTNAAQKDLHIASSDSPTIRFDQNDSDGLPEQVGILQRVP